jgi:hypothetical protein
MKKERGLGEELRAFAGEARSGQGCMFRSRKSGSVGGYLAFGTVACKK